MRSEGFGEERDGWNSFCSLGKIGKKKLKKNNGNLGKNVSGTLP